MGVDKNGKRPAINFQLNNLKKARLENGSLSSSWNKNVNGFANGNNKSQASSSATQKSDLPVTLVKDSLIEEIKKRNTLIIIGETGSGKTTQIPQFIYEAGISGNKMIAITQPRRVAAVSIAQRVASEMNARLGDLVGYSVRFEDSTSSLTKLKYLTDGMLLRETMIDKALSNYSVIILDECHERTVHTDVLFGIVKKIQASRVRMNKPPLKVLIMSATMDVDHFKQYFNDAEVLCLEGREHPVTVYHTATSQSDYAYATLVTVFQLHQSAPARADILVFLTGQEEIETMASKIRSVAKSPQCTGPELKVYTLYASLPRIKYVIDSGLVKQKTHHPGTGLDVLKVTSISQAQAWQRTGRAGREAEGFCYRMYSEEDFRRMNKNTVPEIQRTNLASTVLTLLSLEINAATFDFMDKPPKESISESFHLLKDLGALESIDKLTLTPVGTKMCLFPLDPRFSRIILAASEMGCVDEVLSIVALLSAESVFQFPAQKLDEAQASHRKFQSSAGDHLTLLKIFRVYNNISKKKEWCFENYLNHRNMEYAASVREQLVDLCRRCGISPSSCGQNVDIVRKCLLKGLFMSIAQLQRDKKYITIESRQLVSIHPSSSLAGSLPEYILFTELLQTSRCYMKTLSVIDPAWITEMAPGYAAQHRIVTDPTS
ncbi:hypothetical protein M8J76_003227 [Diaphorina citri]|nr:hypothetical protein M8J75_006714 [Diaphorina citri]KAI5736438.1 hypothetical protein M8J76_003227 [Diaphorina citri]